MQKIVLLSLLWTTWMSLCTGAQSLDLNHHAWYSYSGDHPVAGRWGIHFDGQWRRAELGTEWQQYQLRPGLNYALSRSILLTFGYAFTKSYPYGDFPASKSISEHRIYQQGLISWRWRSIPLQHRIRLEQRFIQYPQSPSTWTYQNRFRYLFKADIPLRKDGRGQTLWYLPVFNEILIGIPPNHGASAFDQNRLFVGIGRVLPMAKLEAGYMKQFVAQRNGRVFELNNTIFITLTSSIPISSLWND